MVAAHDDELSRLVEQLNRKTVAAKSSDSTSLDQLLAMAVQRNASDILLVAGSSVTLRVKGALAQASGAPMSPEDIRGLLLPLLTTTQAEELAKNKSLDFCFLHGSIGRFRANFHYQRGTLAASIRVLPTQIPTLESLHLPPSLAHLAERRQGLVLLTGPTGCGKTSTLAALIDLINSRRRDHIITIEDPIEYQHANRSSIVEQIQVGQDTPSFAHAVRAVLRQDPDVILVGEMRDRETMAAALTAAETGHLVLSSLHTNDASQTMSRILDLLPTGHGSQQPSQMRQQLSLALVAVISQQLVAAADSANRYPALEIMMATSAVRNLIRSGQDHQIRSHISTGRAEGMMTMEQSLAELVRSGRIQRETAIDHCYHVAELNQYLSDSPR
ncbi:twitching motility protein PilT [Silvibacterium bohemicum]|uniref:Twitching motility protein PilT n=1 Tax=Silvibacterium bohemicum TaxID=1577686 RepID=A0A841JYD9_9BACT|nr:PilT/PilU family type 4a pilus ATPase [Silvibacterium bohemicum]MBB6143991.1 twitching motility protein PilT [Silvibacterium bohemicum]